MFKKNKTNPIFELEKELLQEKYVISKIQDNGIFETTEKIMFNAIEKIYNSVLKSKAKTKKTWYIIWGVIGLIVGFLIGLMSIFFMIKK